MLHLQEKYSQIYYAIYLDKYTYWKQATTFNTSENTLRHPEDLYHHFNLTPEALVISLVCVSFLRFGRKMSFLMSNLLNGIAGILVAVAPNYSSLLVFRTLYGFGVKGGWVAGYVWSKGRTFNLTAGIVSLTKLKKHTANILLVVSQSQRSWGWSTGAQWESSTRCSSASASSSSLCLPTIS